MDKYEFNIKVEQIKKKMVSRGRLRNGHEDRGYHRLAPRAECEPAFHDR